MVSIFPPVPPPEPPPPPLIDLFDPNFYRASNPELAGLNDDQAREHFQTIGLTEGRKFSLFYDADFYLASNPDLIGLSDRQLYEHFINLGVAENRNASAFFNFNDYLENNPDLGQYGIDTELETFEHLFEFGLAENREFSPFFDAEYYRLNNPDLVAAGLTNTQQLLLHYEKFGLNEGRRADLKFDPIYYLDTNRDLQDLKLSNLQAFEHYLNYGQGEGRRPSLFYDSEAIDALIGRSPPPTDDAGTPTEETPISERPIIKWDVANGGTLTYSFVTTASSFSYTGTESGVGEVSDPIKNNVRQIMQKYDEILPFNLVEVPDRPPSEGQIRILFSDGPEYAYTYEPGDGIGGDVHLTRNFETDATGQAFSSNAGSFGYESLVHEIGHALGLKHPNNYQGFPLNDAAQVAADVPPFLSFPKDNNTNTAMSYNSTGLGASTPMAYDVRALHSIYGFGDFNSTDTTYKFDSSTFLQVKQSLWDAGGNDTLDFSALLANDTYFFDMNEGGRNTTTSALNGTTYIAFGDTSGNTYPAELYATAIAYGTIIENLIGSQGNDAILGNNKGNRILGAEGADAITGARGADILTGGPGADTFSYAPGDGGTIQGTADVITDFQNGQDTIALGSGLGFEELLITAFGADTIIGVPGRGEILATLTGIQPQVLTSADFTLF